MVRLRALVVFAALVVGGCSPREDVTPAITISPGVKERIMVMDHFRHHGSPRRLLPRVTVEEADDADIPNVPAEESSPEDEPAAPDGGAAGVE